MKIQLDTVKQTITIEEDVNLHEFYEQLNTILPNGKWREFTLKVNKITEWKDPISVPTNPRPYTYPDTYPNIPQIWYTTTGTDTVVLQPGVFNFKS